MKVGRDFKVRGSKFQIWGRAGKISKFHGQMGRWAERREAEVKQRVCMFQRAQCSLRELL